MNFGIPILSEVEELDFAGPWEMPRMWSRIAGGPEPGFIVAQSLDPVIRSKGLSVNPHVDFATRHGKGNEIPRPRPVCGGGRPHSA